eukprot:6180692-Pleurochrysis_carterae.AAC.2
MTIGTRGAVPEGPLDSTCSVDGGVQGTKRRCNQMHKGNAAEKRTGKHAADIADNAAAEGNDARRTHHSLVQ